MLGSVNLRDQEPLEQRTILGVLGEAGPKGGGLALQRLEISLEGRQAFRKGPDCPEVGRDADRGLAARFRGLAQLPNRRGRSVHRLPLIVSR